MFDRFLEIAFRSVVISAATAIAGPIGGLAAMAILSGDGDGASADSCDLSL